MTLTCAAVAIRTERYHRSFKQRAKATEAAGTVAVARLAGTSIRETEAVTRTERSRGGFSRAATTIIGIDITTAISVLVQKFSSIWQRILQENF
jgi:hypothetical protein